MNDTRRSDSNAANARRALAVSGAFYILIAFEFLYMASPFAAYFYGVYGLGLDWLQGSRTTSWLIQFFMPHLVEETTSFAIDIHESVGQFLFLGGLAAFAVGAIQIYSAKLRGRGAVIRRNANTVRTVLEAHLDGNAPVEEALADVGRALAGLLLGDGAVAINRAAISEARTEPVLARILVETGREATLPFFVRYLERCRERGDLDFDDPWEAAETFLGLLLGDKQVRRLLGVVDIPDAGEIDARARQAAARFLRLYGVRRGAPSNASSKRPNM